MDPYKEPYVYSSRRKDLAAIFKAGLKRVDPYRMLIDHVRLEGDTMKVRLDESQHSIPRRDHTETLYDKFEM